MKLYPMQQAFKDYEESEDFRDSLDVMRFFEDPKGVAWPVFIEGWKSAERRALWLIAISFLAGVMTGIIVINCLL